jgi:hypothetical protein
MHAATVSDLEMSHRRAWRATLEEPQHDQMNKRAPVESLVRQSITANDFVEKNIFSSRNGEKMAGSAG